MDLTDGRNQLRRHRYRLQSITRHKSNTWATQAVRKETEVSLNLNPYQFKNSILAIKIQMTANADAAHECSKIEACITFKYTEQW